MANAQKAAIQEAIQQLPLETRGNLHAVVETIMTAAHDLRGPNKEASAREAQVALPLCKALYHDIPLREEEGAIFKQRIGNVFDIWKSPSLKLFHYVGCHN